MTLARPCDRVTGVIMSQDDPTSHEVDRHIDDQPPRDDLIDPEDLDTDELQRLIVTDDEEEDPGVVPPPEEQPETQGTDTLNAPRVTEDAGQRHPLSDEERR
jgi:hypothetical protein